MSGKKMSALKTVPPHHIHVREEFDDYERAIYFMAQPLMKDGHFDEECVIDILKAIEEKGDYICLADDFALPHARPRYVEKTAIGVLVVKTPVELGGNPVRLFILLAAESRKDHNRKMSDIASFLTYRQNIEDLINCDEPEEIKRILEERT